jgi:hypothetical protein
MTRRRASTKFSISEALETECRASRRLDWRRIISITDRPWGRRRGPGALHCFIWQVGDRCAPRHDLVVVVERPVKRHRGTDPCGAESGIAKRRVIVVCYAVLLNMTVISAGL